MQITTAIASARLGITPRRVRELIRTNRLPAQKLGRDYLIEEADLELVRVRKHGRPRTSLIAATTPPKKGKKP
jgi:excisionase family DNA binding protein